MPYADSVTSTDTSLRPQSLMLTFFGIYLLGRDTAVSSGSVIDMLGRAGVSEEAVRSTLTRMVGRGLLERHKRGRKMYFSLTARAETVLREGHDRVWRRGADNQDRDGRWTLVGFSLPESWRRERHDLRSRLTWGGFGPLQNGLWIAPGTVDAAALLADLGLEPHLRVFHATVAEPTEARQIVETAFDLPAIAAQYQSFLERWTRPTADTEDPLGTQLLLHTDWLELVRRDPHLPAEHLSRDWPAARAEELFRTRAREQEAVNRDRAEQQLDTVAVTPQATDPA